jgi:ABC-2 type transport system ATP-binding protein
VLLSTAYMDEAERCDDVILLHEGEVLGHGPPQQFRDRLRGRAYLLSASGLKKRTVQEKLAVAANVVDAVIQGEQVRLVMATDAIPDAGRLLPDVAGVSIQPVPPRLEDSFVAMLRKRHTDGAAAPRLPTAPRISKRGNDGTGPVIEVNHVKRRFGDFYAVKDVSFHVERGEVFGLLGANGAGKSTTFRMLCGLLPVTEGSVRVAGLDLRHAAAAARGRIGYMSQKFSLYGNLSVGENLRFFSSAYGLSGARQREQVERALDEFQLATVVEAASLDLPLGHKQRLAMACALMHEPDILFLDEPTSGVDPLARREFWSRINALAEQAVTIMVTTHFMEEADYCDRLAIMADGKILALGTPAEIKQHQRSAAQPEPTMEEAFIALIEHPKPTAEAAR